MKLSTRDAARYFEAPDRSAAGALIYGADPMRVAIKRQDLLANLLGPDAEAEMRLTRMTGADLRRDGAALLDAVKASGFFPGPRAVLVEEATDGLRDTFAAALEDWREGDAQIVATAGQLPARSGLRKLFEGAKTAFAIAIYNDPPGRAEIEAELARAGLKNAGADAVNDLVALGRALDPGDLRQLLEKLALYKHGDDTPLSSEDVARLAPLTIEAELDDVLNTVAEARTADIGPLIGRLAGQGVQPVGLCIAALRHFKTLYAAASDPGGPASGIGRVRPPVFGPRRDRMLRQAQTWSPSKLEMALGLLTDTDLALRSAGQTAPQMALVERCLIRLSMLAARR